MTFRVPLLFSGLRRFVYFVGRVRAADGHHCNKKMSMNLEIRQRQSSRFILINCDLIRNSAFSPDQSVLNCCSTTIHGCSAAAYAATLPRPVGYTNRPFGHRRRYSKRPAVTRNTLVTLRDTALCSPTLTGHQQPLQIFAMSCLRS